jgi:hypothetical protein
MVGLGSSAVDIFPGLALAVSADGSVIVGQGLPTGSILAEAFVWDAGNGARRLKNVLENDFGLDLTGWSLFDATGISHDGLTVVGRGRNPSGAEEAWIARLGPSQPTVPEPTSFTIWALTGSTLAMFGWRRRRNTGARRDS